MCLNEWKDLEKNIIKFFKYLCVRKKKLLNWLLMSQFCAHILHMYFTQVTSSVTLLRYFAYLLWTCILRTYECPKIFGCDSVCTHQHEKENAGKRMFYSKENLENFPNFLFQELINVKEEKEILQKLSDVSFPNIDFPLKRFFLVE